MDISRITLDDRNVLRVLEKALRARPDALALQDPIQSLTYAQMWTAALRISRGFSDLGLERQEPVLLMLDNHADSVLCWLGLALSARAEVPINTAYKGGMLEHIISDSGSRVIVIEEQYLPRLVEVSAGIPGLATVIVRQGKAAGDLSGLPWRLLDFQELLDHEPAAPEHLDPWDLVSITYTSGTTGRSKGVLCPHAHAFGHASVDGLGATRPGELRYVVLPQFHAAGRWGGAYNAFQHEAAAYIAPGFSASGYWDAAKALGASTSQLVGTMAEFLFRQPPKESDNTHGMREISVLPLPTNLAEWKARFGIEVTSCFGSTEAGAVLSTTQTRSNSVGRVRDGYTVRIVDEHDRELADGAVGELVVRAELPWTTGVGYVNQPEKTATSWRNGWLHTGDALYRNSEGEFFFVDRLADAVRRRGENISSAEVELYINMHPDISESAVVAVPSEFMEDEVKATVVLVKGTKVSEMELVKFFDKTMPYYMVPRYIHIVDELPKTVTAKVKKHELRAAGVAGAWDAAAAGFKPTKQQGVVRTA